MSKYVIIGMGAAGATCAQQLRKLEPESDITIINGESQPFYLRLDLASVLEGKDPEKLIARKNEYWDENNIKVVHSVALKLDHSTRTVFTANGDRISYDKLLIAAGSQARRLNCRGSELAGITTYRTLDDALGILEMKDKVKNVVIVGGGILGMEVAQAGWGYGWDITLLVRDSYPGLPLVDEDGGKFVHAALERGGVKVIYNDEVECYEGNGNVAGIVTKQGTRLSADLVIECIGVAPNLSFLDETEIVERGKVCIDESMRTSLSNIFAAGDAVLVKKADGNSVMCHNWNVAISQARTAAESMTGKEANWSEGVAYNADCFYDQEFAIIGPWDRRHEAGRKVETQTTDNAYRAVASMDGIIESAIVAGDKTGDKLLRRLIASGVNITGKFDKLFDPESKPGDFA